MTRSKCTQTGVSRVNYTQYVCIIQLISSNGVSMKKHVGMYLVYYCSHRDCCLCTFSFHHPYLFLQFLVAFYALTMGSTIIEPSDNSNSFQMPVIDLLANMDRSRVENVCTKSWLAVVQSLHNHAGAPVRSK